LSYSFQDSILIDSNTETINQGDTLKLRCEILKSKVDLTSGKIVNFSNAKNISFVFVLKKLIKKNDAIEAISDFEVIINEGTKVKHFNPDALEILFNNNPKAYLYEVLLIPKKNLAKGIFYIYGSQIGGVYDSKGNNASYNIGLKCKNQHLNLYYDNMPDRILYEQSAKLTYCFGVAE
jgi:hypothetical protein